MMDDDIEIEEHDILEHPEVKAVFLNLSKIQIQDHTAGDAFLNESSVCREETESLLQERPARPETNFMEVQGVSENLEHDKSKEADCVEAHRLLEDTCDDNERNIQENDYMQELSDSEFEAPEIEPAYIHVDSQVSSGLEFVEDVQAYVESKEDDNRSSDVEFVSEFHPEIIVPDQLILVELNQVTEREDPILVDEVTEEFRTDDAFTGNVLDTNVEFVEHDHHSNDYVDIGENLTNGVEDIRDCNHEPTDSLVSVEEHVDNQTDVNKQMSHYNNNQAISDVKQWVLDQIAYQNKELPLEYEVPIKEEADGYDYLAAMQEELYNNDELPPEDKFHYNNKIILGSKPSQESANSVSKNVISQLVVSLDDWSVHLNRSNSYCRVCKTLFTTPNALHAHNMMSHSFLTPLTNRAVKSTAKSSINVAHKNTTDNVAKKSTSMSQSTYCNHCNVTFAGHTQLIKHLYQLLPAKKYACDFCEETFHSQTELATHKSVHIKIEKTVLKAKRNDKNPILRTMLEAPVKIKEDPVETSSETQTLYKCTICGEIFNLYSKTRTHRLSHPDSKHKILFKKLHSNNLSNSKDKFQYEEENTKKFKVTAKTKRRNVKIAFEEDVKVEKHFELIPKSILFKCFKCSMHFTSCYAGLRHCTVAGLCSKAKPFFCLICKKNIRIIDEHEHKKQHTVGSKFRIYTITKDICYRTLCKCPKCEVHFRYLTLKGHIEQCGKIPFSKCIECNIHVPSNSLLSHNHIHASLNVKPKDFIIVEHIVMNDQTKPSDKIKKATSASKITTTPESKPVKRKYSCGGRTITTPIKANTEQGISKRKLLGRLKFEKDERRLYYCENCKCYMRQNVMKSIRMHKSKKCRNRGPGNICSTCGLRVPYKLYKSHKKLHTLKSLTLEDFKFFELKTQRPMVPAVPDYPHCNTCKIHFLNLKSLRDHICGEDYENCDICEGKFEMSALKLHRPYHLLQSRHPGPLPPPTMPELLKKYELINAIWNVIFLCDKCELVTDLYNKAVEHSQAHLKKEHLHTNTIKCYICNLKFDESSWAKHSSMHSRMNINSKNFKILRYVPRNLLDETWFQMFESLPEKEIRQIIDRSVFGSERSLKMVLVKDGLPEFTVYRCGDCQVSYDNNSMLGHIKVPCKASTHLCGQCNIAFADPNTLRFHELLHIKGIKKEEFRIVHFVKNASDPKTSDSKGKPNETPLLCVYRCRACTVCVTCKRNVFKHKCITKHKLHYCKLCKQNYHSHIASRHEKRHQKYPKFTTKHIKIIHFDAVTGGKFTPVQKSDKLKKKVTSCKIELKSSKTGSKTSQSKRGSLNRSKNIPVKLNSKNKTPKLNIELATPESNSTITSFESLVKQITSENPKRKERTTLNSSKHKDNLNTSVENILPNKTAKVYKCDCGLHYTSLRAVECHIQTCDDRDDISKENCSKCGLLFPTDILVSHLCKHHSRNTRIQVEAVHKKPTKPNAPTQLMSPAQDNDKFEAVHKKATKPNAPTPVMSPAQDNDKFEAVHKKATKHNASTPVMSPAQDSDKFEAVHKKATKRNAPTQDYDKFEAVHKKATKRNAPTQDYDKFEAVHKKATKRNAPTQDYDKFEAVHKKATKRNAPTQDYDKFEAVHKKATKRNAPTQDYDKFEAVHKKATKRNAPTQDYDKFEAVHKKATKRNASTPDYDKLYKCGECNVYFLNHNSCYKHTSKHVPLDPMQYIECKMCSLQFRILSLHVHVKRHHSKEFDLQKVLVEEYSPGGQRAPKDIYFANEKLQNVQVTSSND